MEDGGKRKVYFQHMKEHGQISGVRSNTVRTEGPSRGTAEGQGDTVGDKAEGICISVKDLRLNPRNRENH